VGRLIEKDFIFKKIQIVSTFHKFQTKESTMKKILLISILLVIYISSSAYAQSLLTVGGNVGMGLKDSNLDIEYSGNINNSSAWTVRGIIGLEDTSNTNAGNDTYWGGGIGYRGYFHPTVPSGIYWGVDINILDKPKPTKANLVQAYYYGNASYPLYTYYSYSMGSTLFIEPDIKLGYMIIGDSGIVFGFNIFLGYGIDTQPSFTPPSDSGTAVVPAVGINFGVGIKTGYSW